MTDFTEVTDQPWALEGCRDIYEEAFPDEERLDFDMVFTRREGGRRVLVVGEGERVDALAVWLPVPEVDACLLEYLAVAASGRGGGVGAGLLRRVIDEIAPADLLGELEPASLSAQAERRQGFYRRNGFEPVAGITDYGMPDPSGGLLPMELWHLVGHDLPPVREVVGAVYRRAYAERGERLLPRLLAGLE